jgi:hypothetical protein
MDKKNIEPFEEKKMKRKKYKTGIILLAMVLALGVFGNAFGSSGFLAPFNTANGTSYNCGVCHTTPTGSSSARNAFGTDWANASIGNHSYTLTTALANRDSDGDGYTNIVEIQAKTNPGDATSFPTTGADTTLPVVSGFTIPSTASSLNVTITTFTATDNVGVTGFLVNESAAKPLATAAGWSTSRPSSYTFTSAGAKTLYAWAKDAAGNVSNSLSRTVTVTVTTTDTTAPVVTAFTIPSTASSLAVTITTFTATDNVGVTGYLVNETATKPLATAAGWSTTVPSGYTFATTGAKTLYAWAKDGAGNVSSSRSAVVTITLGNATSAAITDFQIPFSSTSLTVPILSFTANSSVTGYLITEMALPVTPPASNAAGWRSTPPTSYTFGSAGVKSLYAWAKDGAGNLAEPWSEMVTITTNDGTPPNVMDFSIAQTSNSLAVPVLSFTATDDVAVTGYLITTTPTQPLATANGWSASPPARYTFTSGGTYTLYGWVKDRAGNVSASLSDTVTITVTDTTPPVVTAFSIPSSSSSLTVRIRTFTATDNVAVTGYMVTTSSTKPSATSSNWRSTPPSSYTFTSAGTKRLYPWAKDGAGNVSALSNYGTVTISTSDSGDD